MIASFKKNKKGILLMLCASLCVCTGQLFWKLSDAHGLLFLLLGFGLYGLGALITLTAYRYGSLSVLQPVLSMNYEMCIRDSPISTPCCWPWWTGCPASACTAGCC